MSRMVLVGGLLIVLGLTGAAGACYQGVGRGAVERVDGGVPAEQDGEPSAAPMILAMLAGLGLASGLALVGIGMGNWRQPRPSYTRPANPWSEQPGEEGDPPTGLV